MRWATILMLVSTITRADDLTAAREHYQAGTKAYEVGEYDEAVREFTAAYKAKDDPNILFNLAQAHRLAGHPVEAEHAYRMYLVKIPDSPNRAEIERIIKEMQKQKAGTQPPPDDPDIAQVRRHVRAGTELYAQGKYAQAVAEFEQGRAIKQLPTIDIDIARCYDRMDRADDAIAAYRRYVSSQPTPGDADEVRARIEVLKKRASAPAAAEPGKPAVAPAPSLAAETPGRGKKIAGIAIGAVGLAALGAGIGMGVLSLDENDRLTHPTSGTRYETTGLAYQNASIALYVVGGAAVITGVALLVVGVREAKRPPMRAQVGF